MSVSAIRRDLRQEQTMTNIAFWAMLVTTFAAMRWNEAFVPSCIGLTFLIATNGRSVSRVLKVLEALDSDKTGTKDTSSQ